MRDLGNLEAFFAKIDAITDDMEYFILDADGQPKQVPMLVWAEWFQDHKNLALDTGEDDDGMPWRVSSIFLGFDHSPFRENLKEKLLWETMTETADERDIFRFATWDECRAFHGEAVARLQKTTQ